MFDTVDIFSTRKRKLSREQIAEVRGVKCFLSEFELPDTGERAYGCHVVFGDDPMKAPYSSSATELYFEKNHALLEAVQIAAAQYGIPNSQTTNGRFPTSQAGNGRSRATVPAMEDVMDNDEMVTWECPDCGEKHEDPEGIETHCRKCGLIVVPYDGFTRDEGKYVRPVEPPKKEG